jgi:uncharacterized protein (DUF2267 family)
MEYELFISAVKANAALPNNQRAEQTARAVLETLADRLVDGDPGASAGLLPAPIDRYLEHPHPDEPPFDLNDFYERVARRQRVSPSEARRQTKAVFAALLEALTQREVDGLLAELPHGYWPVFGLGDDGYGRLAA